MEENQPEVSSHLDWTIINLISNWNLTHFLKQKKQNKPCFQFPVN